MGRNHLCRGYVDLQAGARYTSVKIDIEGTGPRGGSLDESGSGYIWDFLVGFTGNYNINEKWDIPFMAEIGAGDSDLVGGFFTGVGYHFEKVDAYLGFKYLYYDFASAAPLTDETAYGPMLSVKYTF